MKISDIPSHDSAAFFTLAHVCEPNDPLVNNALRTMRPGEVLAALAHGGLRRQRKNAFTDRLSQFNLERELEYTEHIGATFVTRGSVGWPRQLDSLEEESPWVLWSLGSADSRVLAVKSLAIVGTRNCTPYGQSVARHWAAEVATMGVTVVSGGALGIDIAAHQGALDADQPTVCVVASGVQARYPISNERVFARIIDNGVIVSESPPRESPRRQRFLTRNRIIAALTLGTLVIEASTRSGTASTATRAQALGRPVMGVPGSIYSPQSEGIHSMIVEGSAVLTPSIGSVLREIHCEVARATPEATVPDWRSLSQRDLDVWEALPRRGVCTVDSLPSVAHRTLSEVIASLTELEIRGMAKPRDNGWQRC